MSDKVEKINVVSALADSPYENVAEDLAKEFEAVGIINKDQVHNAPLKLKRTFGVDIYEVIRLINEYEESPKQTPKSKTKKSPE